MPLSRRESLCTEWLKPQSVVLGLVQYQAEVPEQQAVEKIILPPVLASSLPSPDEAISSSTLHLLLIILKFYQELLKRVAAELGLQFKEGRVFSHHRVDILSMVGPCRVALPINEVILEPIKAR